MLSSLSLYLFSQYILDSYYLYPHCTNEKIEAQKKLLKATQLERAEIQVVLFSKPLSCSLADPLARFSELTVITGHVSVHIAASLVFPKPWDIVASQIAYWACRPGPSPAPPDWELDPCLSLLGLP